MLAAAICILLAQQPASAWLGRAPLAPARRPAALRAGAADGASWRPDVVDPLGQVGGAPARQERPNNARGT